MSVDALHQAAMPAAGQQHLGVIEKLMSAQDIQVMGLTEAHDPGFVEVLAQAKPAGRCLHSKTNKCALLCDEESTWQDAGSGTLSEKFNTEKVDKMQEDEGAKLHDAVAGRLKGSDVLYIVAYGQSNLKTEKDMSFLGQIVKWCKDKGCFKTGVVLMGDWNTVNNDAQNAVRAILGSDFVIPKSLLKTSNKERTYCSEQMYKAHEKVDTAKDYVFVSKPVGAGAGVGGGTAAPGGVHNVTEAQERFYVSAESGKHKAIRREEDLEQLPLPQLHFSDHVVLATSWGERTETDTEPRKTGTLNVMSGAYNSLEFVGPRGSLSFMVDQVLSNNIEITKDVWRCWANHMINGARRWQAENTSAGKNWDVVGELESLKADARSTSVYIWDVLLDSTLRETISSLEELNKHPDIRIIGKRYALAHGQYRPDLTSFHNGTPDKQQDNLAVFQACVDSPTADNLHTWVAKMLDAILEYKKPDESNKWKADGMYLGDYNYTFAQHAATCLMVGVWMIVCLQQLKPYRLTVSIVTFRILGSNAKLRF